jgi:acetate kinase
MKILTINCGSSSIKYKLFDMPSNKLLAKGLVQKIGEESSSTSFNKDNFEKKIDEKISNHKEGIESIVKLLTDSKSGVIQNMNEIDAIGHRVVHGGETYKNSVIIDEKVKECIKEMFDLAPLHNPPNLTGIEESKKILPEVPMVAVFDTAFHQSLPEKAFTYAIPYELYEKHKIRRYGFHGTSHAYVTNKAAEFLNIGIEKINLITCHLGNGSSIAAIKNGNSIDTSMGLTPLEGLVMGTRSGDLDPAIIFYLLKTGKYGDYSDIDKILNKKSGLLGVSQASNDVRNLLALIKEGNSKAKLAIDIFCYRLKKYIGSYLAVLGKVNAIVFTGGIGENGEIIRSNSLSNLKGIGIEIDAEKNLIANSSGTFDISSMESKSKILVIPTDEEFQIANETYELCKNI